MCLAEKTQVFPIRKNTHGDPQTLQNKHWRTSAKRPTLTVQARNASLLEPRKTIGGGISRHFYGANAVARYFIVRCERESAHRNTSYGATTMPFSTMPRLGFVGAGRLARCLAAVWSRAGYPITAIASRSAASAHEFAGELPECLVAADASAVAQHADILFLTVPDDSIGATANALRLDLPRGDAKAVVHCSGATPVDVLAAAQAQGADIGGFHPLFLFGGLPSDQTRIAGCSVTIEASGSLHDTLTALVQALGCHPLSIPPGGRLLYHAAAHYAASFALCSLSETVALWKELGFAEDDALRAVLPMLAGTIETAREKGLPGALAGPVSRGDAGIVIEQLALLQELGGDHAALYALLSRRAVALAKRRASPPPAEALDAMSHAIELVLNRTGPSDD
jgi:predicted short-subunit dehydrogenase-like oxidoreductase (DUF2520 family)